MTGQKHPTRPADLHDMTLVELAAAYGQHSSRLVNARHRIGEALPGDQVAAHAIAALAVQHELAERALASRWVIARDGLSYGASVAQVATAMGLDEDEVIFGLTRWASGQRRENLISDSEYAAIVALVGAR